LERVWGTTLWWTCSLGARVWILNRAGIGYTRLADKKMATSLLLSPLRITCSEQECKKVTLCQRDKYTWNNLLEENTMRLHVSRAMCIKWYAIRNKRHLQQQWETVPNKVLCMKCFIVKQWTSLQSRKIRIHVCVERVPEYHLCFFLTSLYHAWTQSLVDSSINCRSSWSTTSTMSRARTSSLQSFFFLGLGINKKSLSKPILGLWIQNRHASNTREKVLPTLFKPLEDFLHYCQWIILEKFPCAREKFDGLRQFCEQSYRPKLHYSVVFSTLKTCAGTLP